MLHKTNVKKPIPKFSQVVSVLFFFIIPIHSFASSGKWTSTVTGGQIDYRVRQADQPLKDISDRFMTVVYLENLGFEKVGQNNNETDVNWLLSQGYQVIELDYANNANAVSPTINDEIIAINDEIADGTFCGLNNCSDYRSYVLFEGYRISRDEPYFLNDATVYNYPHSNFSDSLRMDIVLREINVIQL